MGNLIFLTSFTELGFFIVFKEYIKTPFLPAPAAGPHARAGPPGLRRVKAAERVTEIGAEPERTSCGLPVCVAETNSALGKHSVCLGGAALSTCADGDVCAQVSRVRDAPRARDAGNGHLTALPASCAHRSPSPPHASRHQPPQRDVRETEPCRTPRLPRRLPIYSVCCLSRDHPAASPDAPHSVISPS